MKTKIIYISGNEIFDMNDIRAAFEEVRNALNLDKTTVLFGVPVDCDDAGFATTTTNLQPIETTTVIQETEPVAEITEITEEEPETLEEPDIQPEIAETEIISQEEEIIEKPIKKRGRPRKVVVQEPTDTEQIESDTPALKDETDNEEEKVVPILSVLSTKDDDQQTQTEEENIEASTDTPDEPVVIEQVSVTSQEINIIHEISENESEQTDVEQTFDQDEEADNDEESLEKLLSAMTPLQEDALEKPIPEAPVAQPEDVSVDATLQQLASEFAENQDKISAENKSSSRSKIGKLRNILPFKQSKHKDQGLGDLFGWAGIAANDEDFSVPGFFTNVASKK